MSDNTVSKYDRLYGGLRDVSLFTKPSTTKLVQSLTGQSETYVVQTCRHDENGDYIFIERLDENGVVRLAIPPKVAALIASQRDALTKRRPLYLQPRHDEGTDGRWRSHWLPEESLGRTHDGHGCTPHGVRAVPS